jgi:hypothetical protein
METAVTGLAKVDGLEAVGHDQIQPSAPGAIRAFRRLGYKLGEALADLIDNAIDAEAKHVVVRVVYTSDAVARVIIADDGCGMDEVTLRRAMQFGAETHHSKGDLGKYGMGMKTASFSQCSCLSVVTKRNGVVAARQWTERDIQSNWRCARLDGLKAGKLFEHNWAPLRLSRQGTLIIWDEVDRMEPRQDLIEGYLDNKIRGLSIELGLVFHRLIAKKRIKITLDRQRLGKEGAQFSQKVEPVDPFGYPEPGNRHYPRLFKVSMGKLGSLPIHAHIWPARASGPAYSLGGKAAAGQGFYFYRNDRLIQAGGWNGLRQQDDEPHLTLARVAVDLPPRLDSEFALQTQKSGVDVPDAFLGAVKAARTGKLTFGDFIRDAQAAYRRSPEIKYPIVPGKGFPGKVRSRAKQAFDEGLRKKAFTQFASVWTELEPGEFFRVDRNCKTIFLNSDYRRELTRGSHSDAALFKTLLFLLLRDGLQSKMTKKKERWLSACNQLLAAAYHEG